MKKIKNILREVYLLGLSISLTMIFQVSSYADGGLIVTSWEGSNGVIQNDGSLWMWGNNEYGQLGLKSGELCRGRDRIVKPKLIMKNVKDLSINDDYSAFIKNDGSLWSTLDVDRVDYGCNVKFHKIMNDVSSVHLEDTFGLAVKNDNTLWTWGSNVNGQFCSDRDFNESYNIDEDKTEPPVKLMGNVKTAYEGFFITKKDGSFLKCDVSNKCWNESNCEDITFFDDNGAIIPVKQISYDGIRVLLEDGTVWSKYEDLCLRTNPIPEFVKVADNIKVFKDAGWGYVAFITNDNILYTCGYSGDPKLGIGYREDNIDGIPQKVMEDVEDIQLGDEHAIALKLDGSLYSWGANKFGECGLGFASEKPILTPTRVDLPIAIPQGHTLDFNGKNRIGVKAGIGYTITGNVGKKIGVYKAIAKLAKGYKWVDGTRGKKEIKWKIVKAKNSLKIVKNDIKVNSKRLNKGNVVITSNNYIEIIQANGELVFKKSSGSKDISVSKTTGSIILKKGLKKGTYNVEIQVKAKGNKNYEVGIKAVTVVIVIK